MTKTRYSEVKMPHDNNINRNSYLKYMIIHISDLLYTALLGKYGVLWRGEKRMEGRGEDKNWRKGRRKKFNEEQKSRLVILWILL